MENLDNAFIFEFYIIWFYFLLGTIVLAYLYKLAMWLLRKLFGK